MPNVPVWVVLPSFAQLVIHWLHNEYLEKTCLPLNVV